MALVSSAVLDLEMLPVLGHGVMCRPSPPSRYFVVDFPLEFQSEIAL